MIFFVYTDVKNVGVKTPVQDLNKEEKIVKEKHWGNFYRSKKDEGKSN